MKSLATSIGLCLALLYNTLDLTAQQQISFVPKLYNQPIIVGHKYFLEQQKDSVQIDKLQFYIANIYFYLDATEVHEVAQKHFLIDIENTSSLELNCNLEEGINYNKIKFDLGIDSTTNVSGAMGGDLDPTNGMYWTWQSGYINFKLEGSSPLCPARKNEFQFHIGGYQAPYNPLQTIELALTKGNLSIDVNIEQLLDQVDLTQTYKIMSPNAEAVATSQLFLQLFQQSK
ncbi:MAG: hypothetical protein GY810_19390 [Aureispira sp.]|nr:hypothetical protein [Aureispira sp.]